MQLEMKGAKAGTIDINEKVFNVAYHEGLIHQIVVSYLNNARAGTSAQKSRSEVRGGGAKPWKQKGTGRARAGTICSPIWRKGGVTFAAKSRKYHHKINKKMYKKAVCSIISELMRKEILVVVPKINLKTNKTRDFVKLLKQWKVSNVLLVADEVTENLYLASRNLTTVDVIDPSEVNPVALLKYENIICTEKALKEIEEKLQ